LRWCKEVELSKEEGISQGADDSSVEERSLEINGKES